MAGFKDHFSANAAGYAAHRPTYPKALVDFLAEAAPATGLALDCGCGTGQLSRLLADRFAKVVATDASPQQIANAEPHPRVAYRVAPAERSGLAGARADLVAAAQAAHWFDLDAFYAEVRRVARPGGILALITYGLPEIEGATGAIVQDFYDHESRIYWPPERRHVDDHYRSLPFSFEEVAGPDLAISRQWRLAELTGYLDTWSAIRAMEGSVGRGPFERFTVRIAEAWGDPAAPRAVRWPIAMRIGRL